MKQFSLHCPACHRTEVCHELQMAAKLQQLGMLRRENRPPSDLIDQLARSAVDRLACQQCRQIGLTLDDVDDDDDWGPTRPCQYCGQPISPERLAIFPDAEICAACKTKEERGENADESEFCPRCGAILVMRTNGRGITRYAMVCPDCGQKG
jgi:RNA polymerase-binding transcription factor DksA